MALRVCCKRASLVGGNPSTGLPFFVKICLLAAFTVVHSDDRSYIKTTNLSRTAKSHSAIVAGAFESLAKTSVTSGYDLHVSHAVFFPLLAKEEVVSHPVKEYQKSNPEHVYPPSSVAYL